MKKESSINQKHYTLNSKLRLAALFAGFLIVFVVAGIDQLSGPEVTVSVLYVIPVALCAYYLGMAEGLFIAVASAAGYVFTLQSHGSSLIPLNYWNVVLRLIFFVAVAYVLAKRRSAEERLQRSEEETRIYARLHEIDQAILAVDKSDAIAQEALDRLLPLIPCMVATISVFNDDLSEAQILARWNGRGLSEKSDQTVTLEENRETILLQQGKVNHIENAANSVDSFSLTRLFQPENPTCYIIVPLLSQGRLVGSLNLGSFSPGSFSPPQIVIAQQVAHQLAIAIHNSRLFEDIIAAKSRLQLLSQTLLKVQEVEKHHLARELHDEMGQTLTALQIQLEDLASMPESAQINDQLQRSIEIVEQTLERVRDLSLDLRPLILDDLGLVAAVRWYISRTASLGGFTLHFDSNVVDRELSPDLETVLFRVVQEALTNILRHSRASHVSVELFAEQKVSLMIKDNGIGFDVRQAELRGQTGHSLGLLGMRERVGLVGGKIEIESVPAFGTAIKVMLPLKTVEEAAVKT